MKAGWKTRPAERQYFETKLAARQPKPKAKRARATRSEVALVGIIHRLDDTIQMQSHYLAKIVKAIQDGNNDTSVPGAISGLGKDLRAMLAGIESNLIAIYGAMPPEQRDKDIRIMRDALVSMSQGLPTHRDLQLAAERAKN